MTIQQQRQLLSSYITTKDALAIILQRNNGVAVVLPKQVEKYAQACRDNDGFPPTVNVERQANGSLEVKLLWLPRPKPTKPAEEDVTLDQFTEVMGKAGLVIDHEKLTGATITTADGQAALAWARAKIAQDGGVTVQMPAKPAWLDLVVTTPES